MEERIWGDTFSNARKENLQQCATSTSLVVVFLVLSSVVGGRFSLVGRRVRVGRELCVHIWMGTRPINGRAGQFCFMLKDINM